MSHLHWRAVQVLRANAVSKTISAYIAKVLKAGDAPLHFPAW